MGIVSGSANGVDCDNINGVGYAFDVNDGVGLALDTVDGVGFASDNVDGVVFASDCTDGATVLVNSHIHNNMPITPFSL